MRTANPERPGLPEVVVRKTPARGAAPMHHRFWDVWGWFSRLPGPAAFVLPILLLPVPCLLLALSHPSAVPALWAIEIFLITPGLDLGLTYGVLSHNFTWWVIFLTACWVQFLVIVWLLRNLQVLYRWGPAARFLRKREAKALEAYHRRPWLRRFHFAGVMVFVFLPLNSGIFTGVFVGKFTGLDDRKTFLAVYLGTVIWAMLLVMGLTLLEPWLGPIVKKFLHAE